MPKDRFHLYKLFKEDIIVTISEEEIATLYGITLEEVREYIKKDEETKMIVWEPTSSTFYLVSRGFDFLFCIREES